MPRLQVLAGPSLSQLTPIVANSGESVRVVSDAFEGEIAVYNKGFVDAEGRVGRSAYFNTEERKDVTWSIQMQGRFLRSHCVDDILFGNVFERPLKLPWGFGAVVKFMHFIDPTLEHDLASRSKPWALSPLVSTMPHLQHRRVSHDQPAPAFPPPKPIKDDITHLAQKHDALARVSDVSSKRRALFHKPALRRAVTFGPEDLITADFCHDFLHFSAKGVMLRLPGGISIDMMKYWDGQPIQFICCERGGKDGRPWGRVFWCVVVQPVDDPDSDCEKVLEDVD